MLKSISYFMFGVIAAFLLYGAYEGTIPMLLAVSIGVALGIAVTCILVDNEEEATYLD